MICYTSILGFFCDERVTFQRRIFYFFTKHSTLFSHFPIGLWDICMCGNWHGIPHLFHYFVFAFIHTGFSVISHQPCSYYFQDFLPIKCVAKVLKCSWFFFCYDLLPFILPLLLQKRKFLIHWVPLASSFRSKDLCLFFSSTVVFLRGFYSKKKSYPQGVLTWWLLDWRV